MDIEPKTMVELLRWRSQHQADKRAYTFLLDGESLEEHVSYAELDTRARAIAAHLRKRVLRSERALLLFPPGLDYIAALFGCMYAGVVAVPAYPPRPNRPMSRIEAIVADAQASVALTSRQTMAVMGRQVAEGRGLAELKWVIVDEIEDESSEGWREEQAGEDDLAFLQYTSGSTSVPKGVMLSHRNLLHNQRMIRSAFEHGQETIVVGWLPLYHDMGLIGNVFQPLYLGVPSILMSPLHFLQRPVRWLQALTRYRATTSGGPNFAYDLCVRKIKPEQLETLDLSSWTLAFNGAEPIRAETLKRFAEAFAPCGFRPEVFYPCYGLAEATLLVAGVRKSQQPNIYHCEKNSLEQHRIILTEEGEDECRTMVGCGQSWSGQTIKIVDGETRLECTPERVGEVWLKGDSIARGYWNRPLETEQSFHAYLADTGEGPFLRTGDLGFLSDGELVVTGRSKDLIIINGRNHYPQDIERTVEQSHASLRAGCSAAFAVEVEGEEQLVVAAEVERRSVQGLEVEEVAAVIRREVVEGHEVSVKSVVLLKTGGIAKTSSGKIQRHLCRQMYLNGELQTLGISTLQKNPPAPSKEPSALSDRGAHATRALKASRKEEEIQAWLVAKVAELVKINPAEIDVTGPFSSYGIGSVAAVGLTGELGERLGRRLSPTLAYDYPTIKALAHHLAGESEGASSSSASDRAAVSENHEPVAIIGVACRFPGADNPKEFWRLLCEGMDAVTEVPADRWNARAFYDPDRSTPGKMNTRWGGFLKQVDRFDPHFFGISPREAACMDPQQRLLLEVTWEALEDAGQSAQRLAGSLTSVYIGISTNDYGRFQMGHPALIDAYTGTGNSLSIAANRLSYFFDFRGPSVAVDTACSSSLVAVHLACQSIWKGEASLAVAGGVNLILSPAIAINFTKSGATSPDGRCKAFDAQANGYVRSEGAGVVLLKPLARALADKDPIYAVIRGSAINQDGRTNGLMAPNRLSQEAVLREAYQSAGVSPGRVQYVEAHGTGTLLGDPIEAQALGAILAEGRPPGQPCLLGSVKSNIGHLEAAAGVAGLIKTALSLKHRLIPPSIHFQQPNPHIPFDELSLRVQRELGRWPAGEGPALAGVSSFGFGGSNAHLVLEEAPQTEAADDESRMEREERGDDVRLLPISAHSPEALRSLAEDYRHLLADANSNPSLGELCYTASVRRSHHDYRLAILSHSREELIERLNTFLEGDLSAGIFEGRRPPSGAPRLAFIFPGQGPQWWAMGRELLEREPVFRASLEECERILNRYAEWSLLRELTADEASSRLDGDNIEITQVALFAIQVALTALWRSWGIEPDGVIGCSMGEVAAAHAAGCLSLEDAVRVIFNRSHLLQGTTQRGAMATVELSLEEAVATIALHESRLSIAASNGPRSTVLSGDEAALDEVLGRLAEKGIFFRKLRTTGVAGHSPQVEPFRVELIGRLEGLRPRPANVRMVSTVTADYVEEQELDASYWGRNLREPVLFSEAVKRLASDGFELFIEISAHPILSGAIGESLHLLGQEVVALASLRRQQEERATMLGTLGALYAHGYPVDWTRMYPSGGRCVRLPSYPWQRERCWFETAGEAADLGVEHPWADGSSAGGHPLLGRHLQSAHLSQVDFWEARFDKRFFAYVDDHQVQGAVLLPSAAYVEMALAARAERRVGGGPTVLENVEFRKALFLPAGVAPTVQLTLAGGAAARGSFQIYSRRDEGDRGAGSWTLHATGDIGELKSDGAGPAPETVSLEAIQIRCVEEIPTPHYYQELCARGIQYGPLFQGIEQLWRGNGEALGRVCLPSRIELEGDGYHVHPALLDACLQVLGATMPARAGQEGEGAFLPVRVERIRVHDRPGREVWSHARLRTDLSAERGGMEVEGDVRLFDESGRLLVEVTGFRLKSIEHALGQPSSQSIDDWFYQLEWQKEAREERAARPEPAKGAWLICADDGGTGESFAAQLAARGEECLLVFAGARFERLDETRFLVRAAEADDLKQALRAANYSNLRAVVHLWALNLDEPASLQSSALEAQQSLSCGGLLSVVRTFSQTGVQPPPRLWVITRGAQPTGLESICSVAQSPLWGLGRTIAEEHPALWGGLIDLDPSQPIEESMRLLCEELLSPSEEDQIALRQSARHVARLVRYRRGEPSGLSWRTDAAYLITGGLGDLGLEVARWMVEQGARRLVLLGRTPLPPRAQWSEAEPHSRLANQIAAIRELELRGASVHPVAVDVADEEQLASFLRNYEREGWPPLRGVVHAAGVVEGGPVLELEAETLLRVMRPKVLGAWSLHRLLADQPLDFFVLFSSGSSLLNSPLLGAYAAANAFLDGLAHYRRALGLPALSINWGFWSGVGMAARYLRENGREFAPHGMGTFTPEQGLDALGRLMRQSATEVCVMPIDWQQWAVYHPTASASPVLAHLIGGEGEQAPPDLETAPSSHGRLTHDDLASAPPEERREMLEAALRQQVATVLKLSPSKINSQTPLIHLGIDSIMAIELKNRIESGLGITVPIVTFLQGPSIETIAAQMTEQITRTAASVPGAGKDQPDIFDGPADETPDPHLPTIPHAVIAPDDEREIIEI